MSSVLINNKWRTGSGQRFASLNPANQEVVWQGNAASIQEVDDAIAAAKQSFKSWSILSLEQRQEYIEKYISILENNKAEYAKALSLENGKPFWEALTEVATMIGKYQGSVNSYHARSGFSENKADSKTGISNRLVHRPIGVMVVFGPFNFPGHLPNGHIIPALLAGNTVVFKPSELTPLCGELMIKYWCEAGLPDGVINLVQGGSEVGVALTKSKDINGVLFTGSYKVGKIIHQALAGRVDVLLALEMGGNNPLIIDDNLNNLNAAVYNTIQSAFITAGQRCTCARRLYVPKSDFGNNFITKLVDISSQLAVSDGINSINLNDEDDNNKDPFMGPVISINSKNNIIKFKNNLLEKYKSKELLELKGFSENSALLSPGIIEFENIEYIDEECFGPLLQIYRYNEFSQAIDAANNTKFGLSAGIFSDNKDNIAEFNKYIRAGIVNWNRPTTGAAGSLPFGGIGCSGNYNPGAFYAADYCAYPMASQFSEELSMPEKLSPGVNFSV